MYLFLLCVVSNLLVLAKQMISPFSKGLLRKQILFKDEQLREAQAWTTRAHEMDTLHSLTIHSLQAELRERTEQYNQLWMGCQRRVGGEIIHNTTFSSLFSSFLYRTLNSAWTFSLTLNTAVCRNGAGSLQCHTTASSRVG